MITYVLTFLPCPRNRRGDTGTGKSELLALYDTVINSNCDIVPDLFSAVRLALKAAIQAAPNDAAFAGMFEEARNGAPPRLFLDRMTDDDVPRFYELIRNNIAWTASPGLVDKVRFLCAIAVPLAEL